MDGPAPHRDSVPPHTQAALGVGICPPASHCTAAQYIPCPYTERSPSSHPDHHQSSSQPSPTATSPGCRPWRLPPFSRSGPEHPRLQRTAEVPAARFHLPRPRHARVTFHDNDHLSLALAFPSLAIASPRQPLHISTRQHHLCPHHEVQAFPACGGCVVAVSGNIGPGSDDSVFHRQHR